MKKTMAMLLCVLLAFSVMLTGCANEKDALIGTWRGSVDLVQFLNEGLSSVDPELGEYLRVSEFKMVYNLTFNEDGTYTMGADRDAVREAFDAVMKEMEVGLTEYLEYILNAQGLDMSVEEFMALSGLSMDALMEEAFTEDMMEEIASSMDMQGKFDAKDGKLYMSESLDTVPDTNVFEYYKLEGVTLTIDEGTQGEDRELMEFIYPMVLTKVK